MKAILPIYIFIDACGWEIIKDDPFCKDLAPNRRRLNSVFGYSSACVPSILSGRWPDEHRNWCYFVYDPNNSPFKFLKPLRWLPKAITSRRIFRRWLSKLVKFRLKFRGYFDLYNIPFKYISLFDFTEKKSPLSPGGMNRGSNLSDFLKASDIAHHISEPTLSENETHAAALADIQAGQIDFAFVYWPELDGMLHREGNLSPEVPRKLRGYEERIKELTDAASANYDEVRLYVFSDHGMANCDALVDLKAKLAPLPLEFGKDYAAVYDSTMARFWFFNERARSLIAETLKWVPEGRVLHDEELARMHCLFPDRYFGEMIFLLREGVLIVPSDMGERPIRAMHGYHPDEKQSYAALLTNQPTIPDDITAIPDIYELMAKDALLAQECNRRHASPEKPIRNRFPATNETPEPAIAFSACATLPKLKEQKT